jgi:two-component system, sensor histidine kinase and response regulator
VATARQPLNADILVVDDIPANLRLLLQMLTHHQYQVRAVTSGKEALAAMHAVVPDIVLLDINMPIMNGFEVCSAMQQDEVLAEVPVIFISALGDSRDILRGFEVGGVDYITKPFTVPVVLARVDTHLRLANQRKELEYLRQQELLRNELLSHNVPELINKASHEIRNPLAGNNVTLYLLARHGRLDDEMGQRYLQRLYQNTAQIDQALRQLSNLTRDEFRAKNTAISEDDAPYKN